MSNRRIQNKKAKQRLAAMEASGEIARMNDWLDVKMKAIYRKHGLPEDTKNVIVCTAHDELIQYDTDGEPYCVGCRKEVEARGSLQ